MNNHNEENTIRDWLDQLHGLISEAGNVSNKIDSVVLYCPYNNNN